jgi:Right handed beta helix region/FG-GAP-like repeat
MTVVHTGQELLDALANPPADGQILLDDAAEIDLTGTSNIAITRSLTLKSGRGQRSAFGGLLFTDEHGANPVFLISGNQTVSIAFVRLRFRGPTPDIGSEPYVPPVSAGIQLLNPFCELRVEDCELSGWSYSPIHVQAGKATIRNNWIHHNRRTGLGYGVVVDDTGFAEIEGNTFDHNRHAIAGSGDAGTEYVARGNVVSHGQNGHSFDMHRVRESECRGLEGLRACIAGECPVPDCLTAGKRVTIEGNVFLDTPTYAVNIRGIPKEMSFVRRNSFAHVDQNQAVIQARGVISGNVDVSDNEFGVSRSSWYISWRGITSWQWVARSNVSLENLAFADFTGNRHTDVFWADGHTWWLSESGRKTWKKLASSGYTRDALTFGDFTGNGRADVFRADGQSWWISEGGTESWKKIATSGYTLKDLAFGDFTGNGRTDVFRADGQHWWISEGGTKNWKQLATSAYTIKDLRFGDFTGDGRADVFRADGQSWWISKGATGNWEKLATSRYTLQNLGFADFTGNGRMDVFRADGQSWWLSEGGTANWKILASSSYTLKQLAFGDFDGDGCADVFRADA